MKALPLLSLALLIGFCAAYRPLEKICGRELHHRIQEICTPYGEQKPCYHRPDWNKKTAYEKILEVTSRIKRYSTRQHYFEEAAKMCCDQECHPNNLQKLCCNEGEARIFYKFLKNLEARRPPNGFF